MLCRTRSCTRLLLKLTFACSIAFIYIQIQLLPVHKKHQIVRKLITLNEEKLPRDQVAWKEVCKSNTTDHNENLPTNSSIKMNIFRWNDVTGASINSLIKHPWFPRQPSVINSTSSALVKLNALHYGQWIVGYLHVDVTGEYMFGISSDDSSEFWLSNNDKPDNAKRVAMVGNGDEAGWSRLGRHTKYYYQISDPIPLQKCQKYFIEIVHKQSQGDGFVALSWKQPGYDKFFVVSGTYLSPLLSVLPSVIAPSEVIFNKELAYLQTALQKWRRHKTSLGTTERYLKTKIKRLEIDEQKRSKTACKQDLYKASYGHHSNSIVAVYPLLPSNGRRNKRRGNLSVQQGDHVMSEKTAKTIIGEYLPLMETFHSGYVDGN